MYLSTQPKPKFTASQKTGVLLVNLGTPDQANTNAVKRYLAEFLSDTRVIEPPPHKWIWQLILRLLILNIRPRKSAKAYASVWATHGEGSPLLDISLAQLKAMKKALVADSIDVELGMTYGNPSIASALQTLEQSNCNKIIVLPLYPQYASASTGAVFDATTKVLTQWRNVPELVFINCYYQHPLYIKALANSVKTFQKTHGVPDLLLLSYHGIPKRHADNGDVYPEHCQQTTMLLCKSLGLLPHQYQMTYQSRVGKEVWLTPYTEQTLKSLPSKGVKNIQVICPGFSVDCLETLEEIQVENKEYFLAAGGSNYQYIPALNDNTDHILALTDLVKKHNS